MFEIDKNDILHQEVEFKGTAYYVVENLNHNLLLVLSKADLENGEFPLTPSVIPDVRLIEALQKMKK